ncbi:MAG: hypothetical protein LKG14_07425, partial [Prevotella sp.]|nr:hypothetical protein [Prevotella sp.]
SKVHGQVPFLYCLSVLCESFQRTLSFAHGFLPKAVAKVCISSHTSKYFKEKIQEKYIFFFSLDLNQFHNSLLPYIMQGLKFNLLSDLLKKNLIYPET